MDISNPLMVVGTAERKIQIINLQSPTTVFKTVDSPLRWQTRVVRGRRRRTLRVAILT